MAGLDFGRLRGVSFGVAGVKIGPGGQSSIRLENPMTPPRPAATKAVLLDFDMTLVDSAPAVLEATNRFADDIGRPRVDRETLLSCIGLPLEGTWTVFRGGYDPAWPALYQERYKELETRGFRLFPDTGRVLSALRAAAVKTAVVTNRWMASLAVKNAGIGEWFDAIVGAEEVKNLKPDPEPALKALELLGVRPSEAVYVGDTVIDMETALGAGVDAVGVTTGGTGRDALASAGAKWVIGSLGELPAILGL
jgi:phosphoglycolate phosphatase